MTGQLTDMGAAAQIFWPLWERLLDKWPEIVTATWETLQMVLLSTVFSLASGFLLAILMIVTNPLMSLRPCRPVYQVVDFVVNLLRSFPFIILLIAIIPVTRLVVGTSIGSAAAIVPLTVAAAPFVARLIEGCFLEVDKGVIEAARSFGRSFFVCCCRKPCPPLCSTWRSLPSPCWAIRLWRAPWAAAVWAIWPSNTATTAFRWTSWFILW